MDPNAQIDASILRSQLIHEKPVENGYQTLKKKIIKEIKAGKTNYQIENPAVFVLNCGDNIPKVNHVVGSWVSQTNQGILYNEIDYNIYNNTWEGRLMSVKHLIYRFAMSSAFDNFIVITVNL